MADSDVQTFAVPDRPDTSRPLDKPAIPTYTSQPPLQGQAKIDQMASDAQDNTDAAARAFAGFEQQRQGAQQQLIEQAKSVGDAKEAASRSVDLVNQTAEQANLKAATSLGTNPDAASYVLDQVAAQYKKNSETAQMYADKVAYASNPDNILDNPFKWVKEAILMDFSIQGQQSAERAAQIAKDRYIGLNQMTQQDTITHNAIKQTTTGAVIEANAKAQRFQYDQVAAQAAIDNAKNNATGVIQALQLQNQPFEIERQRQASANSAEQLELARKTAERQNLALDLQISRERIAAAREARQDQKFQEAEQQQQDIVDIVNSGATVLGVGMKFKSVKELDLALKSPEFKDKIDTLYHAGLQMRMTATANPDGSPNINPVQISGSPYKTLGFVQGLNAQLSPGQQPVVDYIKKTNDSLSSNPATTGMKPQQYAAKLDSDVQQGAAVMYRDIGTGNNNIYAPPPMPTLIQNPQFIEGAPDIAKQFKLKVDLGTTKIDFNDTITNLMSQVKGGAISLDSADSQLKFLAAKIQGLNNATRQYKNTAGLPDLKNVNVNVDIPNSGFGRGGQYQLPPTTTNVDLLDDNKRRALLNKFYSANIPPVLRQQSLKVTMEK